MATKNAVLYACGICECYHPWEFNGDCRDNANRYGSPEAYAVTKHLSVNQVDVRYDRVRYVDDRVRADEAGQ